MCVCVCISEERKQISLVVLQNVVNTLAEEAVTYATGQCDVTMAGPRCAV